METLNWKHVAANPSEKTSTKPVEWPVDSTLKTLADILIPQTPTDVGLTLAGGPIGKGVGMGLAGILKYIPWEQAKFLLPGLQEATPELMKKMNRLIGKTEDLGVEHGLAGIKTETRVPTRTAVGGENNVILEHPPEWFSARGAQQFDPRFEFHTHPGSTANPFPSERDVALMARTQMPGARMLEKTGLTRPNQEYIVNNPGYGYSWITFGANPVPVKQFYRPGEVAEDSLARLIYGAKKDRWDLQLGFNPVDYGVAR